MKQSSKENKLASNFSPEEFIVIVRNGSDVTLCSKETERVIHRNIAHLKLLETKENAPSEDETDVEHMSVVTNQTIGSKATASSPAVYRSRREIRQPSHLKDFKINDINYLGEKEEL